MKTLINQSIKLLLVGFLLVGNGLLQAVNTITNQTGHQITVQLYFPGAGKYGFESTIVASNSSINISEQAVYFSAYPTLRTDSSIAELGLTTIDSGKSYTIILGPDGKTLVLTSVSDVTWSSPAKGKKPGK